MAGRKKHGGSRTVVIPEPNEKQKRFFEATTRYIGYGGAKGGGKSWAVRVKGFMGCLCYPGIRILMMRLHYPELNKNLIQPLLQLVPPEMATYNGQEHILTFENGSTITFGHWSGEQSMNEYNGLEFDWIFMDEATQFSEDAFRFMGGCLRGVNNIPKRMYITCNPGGVGHRWVKRLFIDREYKTDSENPEENETPEDYTFIFATVDDNKALMGSPGGRGYLQFLSSLPENVRKAYRYGDWNMLGGNYFKEFGPGHVAAPFQIPDHWPRYRAFDYGLDMLHCLWFAVDEDGRSWCYREVYGRDLIVQDAAKKIKDANMSDRVEITFAPDDIWSRQKDSGKTMAAIFIQNGVPIAKASRNRVQGHMAMHEMLCRAPVKDPFVKANFGEQVPMLMFFSTCKRVIHCMGDIQADDKDPNDCAKEPHEITHAVDAARYYCIMRVMQAQTLREREAAYEGENKDEDEDYIGGDVAAGYIGF